MPSPPFLHSTPVVTPRSSQEYGLESLCTDSRGHGDYKGTLRYARMPNVCVGGGYMCKSSDGERVVIAGRDTLRILTVRSNPSPTLPEDHKEVVSHASNKPTTSIGPGAATVECSPNFWVRNKLRVSNATMDVGWAHGSYTKKIVTGCANGEMVLWDLGKGGSKVEKIFREHNRAVHQIKFSPFMPHSFLSGSSDSSLKLWDLRAHATPMMTLTHPTAVRSLCFSPVPSAQTYTLVALESGMMMLYDMRQPKFNLVERIAAHKGAVTSIDWALPSHDATASGGWVCTGGMDMTVKIWDLTELSLPVDPVHELHMEQPVRKALWRPNFDCEVLVVPLPPGAVTETRDLIEGGRAHMQIWDVRRSWISKWKLEEVQSVASDVSFHDSHALWAIHASGTFVQHDLRAATRPVDAIPRLALSWTTDGTLGYIADRTSPAEIPFDDVEPELRQILRERGVHDKKPTDPPFVAASQTVATSLLPVFDAESFVKLAKGYVLGGMPRERICEINAKVAHDAGQYRMAQTWQLLASLITPLISPTPPPSPMPNAQALPTSTPLTSAQSSPGKAPFLTMTRRTVSLGPSNLSTPLPNSLLETRRGSNSSPVPGPSVLLPNGIRKGSGGSNGLANSNALLLLGRKGSGSSLGTAVASLRRHGPVTPTSSASSSPGKKMQPLPPLHPHSHSAKKSPAFSGMGVRRASMSANRDSPSDGGGRSNSFRHIGEGALDDTDSESEDEEYGFRSDDQDLGIEAMEQRLLPHWHHSLPPPHTANTIPSLLSRSALVSSTPSSLKSPPQLYASVQEEDEDADEEGANSGPSSGNESSEGSDGSPSPPPSPTVAKLSNRKRPSASLTKQESQSSIRTAIPHRNTPNGDDAEEESSDSVKTHRPSPKLSLKAPPGSVFSGASRGRRGSFDIRMMNSKKKDAIKSEEARATELAWEALRDTLEFLADKGEVQMCTALSTVAPTELNITTERAEMFADAYIDMLSRLRLHTCATYVRKHAKPQPIRNISKTETTIYTSCGRCGKKIEATSPQLRRGEFSYCQNCRSTAKCSICRIPVRTLLVLCPGCGHGGHQECFRRFFLHRPMIKVEVPKKEKDGNDSDGYVGDGAKDEDQAPMKVVGHPCAAGCGHVCWAANEPVNTVG